MRILALLLLVGCNHTWRTNNKNAIICADSCYKRGYNTATHTHFDDIFNCYCHKADSVKEITNEITFETYIN